MSCQFKSPATLLRGKSTPGTHWAEPKSIWTLWKRQKLFPYPKMKPRLLGATTNKSKYLISFRHVFTYFGKLAKIIVLFLLFEHTMFRHDINWRTVSSFLGFCTKSRTNKKAFYNRAFPIQFHPVRALSMRYLRLKNEETGRCPPLCSVTVIHGHLHLCFHWQINWTY